MKSADYHAEMNATEHFTEWWTDKLLSNLPEGAVIVMDNAPYHTVKTDDSRCPMSSSRKAELQELIASCICCLLFALLINLSFILLILCWLSFHAAYLLLM